VTRAQLQEVEQHVAYFQAHRKHIELLARYGSIEMDEEERVRLTARRVGMDLPEVAAGGKC
jgi:hypothetical protein